MRTSIRILALSSMAAALLAGCSRKASNIMSPSITPVALPGISIIQDGNTMYCSDASGIAPQNNVNQDTICTTFNGIIPAMAGDIEYQCGGTAMVYTNYYSKTSLNLFTTNVSHGPARFFAPSGSYGPDSQGGFSYLRLFGHYPSPGGTTYYSSAGTAFTPSVGTTVYYSPSLGVTTAAVADAMGVNGTQATKDFYIRWEGQKVGANNSFDYANITMYFNSLRAPHAGMDMRHYQGFSFYARGKGNFGVGLTAGNAGGLPYKDYNVYELVFGDQLIDENRWRQVVVYFQDMKQLYLGKGYVNINDVLANLSGIQFQQETPVTLDYVLDLDYIRFF